MPMLNRDAVFIEDPYPSITVTNDAPSVASANLLPDVSNSTVVQFMPLGEYMAKSSPFEETVMYMPFEWAIIGRPFC